MAYDQTNVFARVLRGEIPCKKRYEDAFALAFDDIGPQAPVHILVIPKGEYVSFDDFTATAPAAMIAGFFRAVGEVARQAAVANPGYRLITNIGPHGRQEVLHFHAHILGGKLLGRMLPKE